MKASKEIDVFRAAALWSAPQKLDKTDKGGAFFMYKKHGKYSGNFKHFIVSELKMDEIKKR